MGVGQVAVPFGICTEPSNVKAGGQSCPCQFTCLGCGHFHSDPSFRCFMGGVVVAHRTPKKVVVSKAAIKKAGVRATKLRPSWRAGWSLLIIGALRR